MNADNSIFITYLGVACILLLILTLIAKELVRAYNGVNTEVWMKRLNIAIIPILVLFGLIVVLRLIQMF
jgi:hypothetical protein